MNFSENSPRTFKSWDDSLQYAALRLSCCCCRKLMKRLCPVVSWDREKNVWSASEGSTHAVRTHHIFPSFHVTFLNKSETSAARERSVAWQGEGQNWTNQNQLCIHLIFPRFAHIVCLLRYLIGLLKSCGRRDWSYECSLMGSKMTGFWVGKGISV